jgi:hypothetical protein
LLTFFYRANPAIRFKVLGFVCFFSGHKRSFLRSLFSSRKKIQTKPKTLSATIWAKKLPTTNNFFLRKTLLINQDFILPLYQIITIFFKMKKIILLLSFLPIFVAQSQVTTSKFQKGTFEPGTYISQIKGQNIKLVLNPDKTYDMSFFFGEYLVKNDTLKFKNFATNSQKFVIKPNPKAAYSSTLKLKLNYDLSYYYTEIYIGTQTDENRKVSYKPLKDFFNPANEDLTQQTIDVEKSKFIYIVDSKYNNTTIFKFRIPEDINEAELEYNPYTNSETELYGYIDSSNQFTISDGKTPILFNFEKEDKSKFKIKTDYEPIDVKTDKNWLKENGFYEEAIDAVAAASDSYKPPYVFKHKISSSLSNALSEIKKTPTKFLIVVYDPKNKNGKTEFQDFVKTSEEAITSYMYSEYNATYDNFNFYLSTDKSLLSKNNINSDQEILVLNSDGEMIYHTKGSIDEKKELFSIYNSIYKELKIANDKLILDKILNAKNASVKEIKTVLRKTLSSETVYAAAIAPPVMAVDEVKFTPPVVKEDVIIDSKIDQKNQEIVEEAIDSVPMVVEEAYDNYYDIIKDKENLYQLKATKQAVLDKWKKVLDNLKNSKTHDKEFVQIIKAELSNAGFSQKMFPRTDYNSTNLDFEMLDYVFSNYQLLAEPPTEKVDEAIKEDSTVTTEYDSYYEQDIKTVLNSYFSYSNFKENPQIEKVLKYYKKYLQISGFDATAVQNYLSALKLNIDFGNNKQEYLETYENYFNSIVKENSSIIENLDAAFSQKSQYDYADWTSYKYSFANLANDVSWYLVENSNEPIYLKKALKWSETSLIVEKNNHYYLDTLAQLYYKNGDKQKAIATEQKAIDANKEGDNLEEYKMVLEKMKNGTY